MRTRIYNIHDAFKILDEIRDFNFQIGHIQYIDAAKELTIRLQQNTSYKQKLINSIKALKNQPVHMVEKLLKISFVDAYDIEYYDEVPGYTISAMRYDEISRILILASDTMPFELLINTYCVDIELLDTNKQQPYALVPELSSVN